MDKKKQVVENEYLNLEKDVSLKIVDTYLDTVKSKWVAKVIKETGKEDTVPLNTILEGDNYCRLP
jgi:hypothetical protein